VEGARCCICHTRSRRRNALLFVMPVNQPSHQVLLYAAPPYSRLPQPHQ